MVKVKIFLTVNQRGLNTKSPTIVFFLAPPKPFPSYDYRQTCIGDTVSVKSREMAGRTAVVAALQRQYTENLKQIFLEMKLRGLSPNSFIPVSVSDLYIPTVGLPIPILPQEKKVY